MVVGIVFVGLWGVVGEHLCVNEAVMWAEGVPVPWTHHNWNEAIGYGRLEPIEYWLRRKGSFKNDDTTRLAQDNPSDLNKKAPRVDSMSLSPTQGRLKSRLNHDTTIHMLLPPLFQNTTCQLQCWANKETHPLDKAEGSNIKPSSSRSRVMWCEACAANLCLKSWELFLTEKRLKSHVFDILGDKDGELWIHTH